MRFRDDRYRDVLKAKRLEPADIHHRTGISYPQLGRYVKERGTKGFCVPTADTLGVIVWKLELDANYLLDTDSRYKDMPPLQAAAHMSLDRYLAVNREVGTVTADEMDQLRVIATEHSDPPVWAVEWKRQHESMGLAKPLPSMVPTEPTIHRSRPLSRRRRLPSR
jgi:hypothetical protein